MPRIHLLASALALAIVSTAAQAQQFDQFVAIGDSLTDSGNIALALGLPAGNSFTTNPDPVAAQIIANAFGLSANPSLAGGTDFAWGGACVGNGPCENPSVPRLSTQIAQYLAANGGHANANGLISYWGGANDIFGNLGAVQGGFITSAQAGANIAADGQIAAAQVGQLTAAGSQHVIVFNLPDIGATPEFRGTPFQSSVTQLVLLFNGQLNAGLSGKTGIVPVDTFGLFNEILASPSTYGFTNVTTPACSTGPGAGGAPSSVQCGPSPNPATGILWSYAPGTNLSYAFADGVHPTGGAHALIAQYVLAELSAPGMVSMLAEAPLSVFDAQSRVLRDETQADMSHPRADGTLRTFADFDYSHQRWDATPNSPNTSSHNSTLTIGSDYYVNDAVSVGLTTSIGYQDASFAGGGGFRNTEPLFSAFGVWHDPNWYVSLQASIGQLNFNSVQRVFHLGAATRTESGDTSGSHTGVELAGGYYFNWGDLKSGPFASISSQRVRVGAYNETTNDSSSMVFGRQTRNSTLAKIGWQLAGDSKMFDSSLHPFARVAYEHESDNNARNVTAGLVGLNGTFSLPGYLPESSWWSAELGVSADFGSNLVGFAAYNGLFGNSTQRVDSFNIGMKWSF
jgi:outer membrane lipase/esterase